MIGIIILNYITYKDTIKCIQSIRESYTEEYKIYLVDNASPNESREVLSNEYKNENNICQIYLEENNGYSAGNNEGIKRALNDGCEYILISNSDVIYHENSIKKLYEFIKNTEDAGIVGPATYTVNDELYYYVRKKMEYRHIIASMRIFINNIGKNIYKKLFFNKDELMTIAEVGCVQGCCMIINSNVFNEIGLFDENVFLYMEEPILERKLHNTKYKTYYYPYSKITHIGGASTAVLSYKTYVHDINSKYYYCDKYLRVNKFLLLILNIIALFQYILIVFKTDQKNLYKNIKEYINIRASFKRQYRQFYNDK